MKSFLLCRSLPALLLLSGCFHAHPPTSHFPGLYSATTGVRITNDSLPNIQPGWADDNVLLFDSKSCPTAFNPTLRLSSDSLKLLPSLPGPGMVLIRNNGLGIDEAEISNREWRHYELLQQNNGVAAAALAPRASAQPVPDYHTNPFYSLYPVVGISYEQAQDFCRWRGQVVTANYNAKLNAGDTLSPTYVRFVYRLPTEAEWEHAALLANGKDYGTDCLILPVRVVPGAADYLRQRSNSNRSAAEIRTVIIAYNKTRPTRSIINYAQPGSDFLAAATPDYLYQGPKNGFGLYQMLGNVAEMVQERGITKGGSYRDALPECRIKAQGRYAGPAPTIGFRAVGFMRRKQ